jgi:TatD DNase family protein
VYRYPRIFTLAGVHPQKATQAPENYIPRLRKILNDYSRYIVGIGEVGVDLHLDIYRESRERQLEVFEDLCALAVEFSLPVSIHSWEAFEDTVEVLRKYRGLRGVFHCFSYGSEQVEIIMRDLPGFYISASGSITYPKNSELRQAFTLFDPTRIVVETDSPFQPPQKYRGKGCSPWMVKDTCQALADLKNIGTVDFYENSLRLFTLEL